MITFQAVTKRFTDGTTAVADLDLDVHAGETCVLVGPSGCGKTTTLRMVNRMIEPTSGTITVDGRDVGAVDPPRLRRGMGYVIQHTGLFPHRTIAQNIATVPRLLRWDKVRSRRRVEELMHLVGLAPETAGRYPHQLSGGQQQRVGVARALAVDPPVMLMDEPFAATDPITRTRLQDEFLRLQQEVRKTVVFVTHDIDEAIKMGDRIAVLRVGGTLAQHASPEELLAHPADHFVSEFLGQDRGLRWLGLLPVTDLTTEPGPVVHVGDGPEEVSAVARAHASDWVVVLDDTGAPRGWAPADGAVNGGGGVRPFGAAVRPGDSIRTALDAMLTSAEGIVVRLDTEGCYAGLLRQEHLNEQLAGKGRR